MREKEHRNCCNRKVNKRLYNFINNNGGWTNWEIIVEIELKEYNKHELKELEQIYINLLEPKLNVNLEVNKIPKWSFFRV